MSSYRLKRREPPSILFIGIVAGIAFGLSLLTMSLFDPVIRHKLVGLEVAAEYFFLIFSLGRGKVHARPSLPRASWQRISIFTALGVAICAMIAIFDNLETVGKATATTDAILLNLCALFAYAATRASEDWSDCELAANNR